jgi:heme/copper-type cytochrome/quinol oxidase subunit 2
VTLGYTGTTWTQIIVAFSIFVPVAVTIVLTVVFLRGGRNDPDAQRLRRAQAEYEARRDRR